MAVNLFFEERSEYRDAFRVHTTCLTVLLAIPTAFFQRPSPLLGTVFDCKGGAQMFCDKNGHFEVAENLYLLLIRSFKCGILLISPPGGYEEE